MALLDVEGLTKCFGGLKAVSNLSFQVNEGEILGLIGPNGAGKTTVFSLITGFVPPNEGKVLLEGKDIVGLKPYSIAHKGVARTFQIVKPFRKLTVLENVSLAAFLRHSARKEAEAEARRVLERVELIDKAASYASDLTLSEQKRLEIARALATNPKVLLLDEPMGGLNPTEIDHASILVRDICKSGVTIVWVEHVLKAIMNSCHRVIVIHHGEKIADMPPEQIVINPVVIEAYLGKKANSYKKGEPIC
ncbi:MAG TPA: ABC transporter ATP-binding protein [Syntrophorhabdaceae bacterium]|nr:ABC transporter ATP-binding protein [Syntrophorhabdaceae bacterium]